MALTGEPRSLAVDRSLPNPLVGFGDITLFKPDGPELKKDRRLFAQTLHPRVVRTDFAPLQHKAARRFCKTLLEDPDPDRLSGRLRQYVNFCLRFCALLTPTLLVPFSTIGEVIHKMIYGASEDGDVDLVDLGNTWVAMAIEAVSGYVVDFVPWCT